MPGFLTYALAHQSTLITALGEHLYLVVLPLGLGVGFGVPLGLWTARRSPYARVLLNLVNSLRVIPSLAILFLAIPLWGLSDTSALFALTLLACPPIVNNVDAAFRSLDPLVLESAQGVGLSHTQQFWQVEFPLALPMVLAGLKTATVETIASATLAAFIGAGGLGQFIVLGFATYDPQILLVGAIPVAILAVGADLGLGALQRWLVGWLPD